MIKKYDLAKAQTYMKGGVEKTFWQNVGTMTEFEKTDGSKTRMVEIPAIGLKCSVFEQKPRNTQNSSRSDSSLKTIDYSEAQGTTAPGVDLAGNNGNMPCDEIDPSDIPF